MQYLSRNSSRAQSSGSNKTMDSNKDMQDDISAFFSWKSSIEKNDGPKMSQEMTASDLSRRLSVSTILSDGPAAGKRTPRDPRQRMPPNREVELISKWRDVDMADLELQQTRQTYANKMAEFEERWLKLEEGQLEVKQNLIKFNNFVREKQGKVEGGLERMRTEQEQQVRREKELRELRQKVDTLCKAKSVLGKTVKDREIFSQYLGRVVDLEPDNYPDIRSLMERCQALVGTKNKLKELLSKTEAACEEQTRALERFKDQKMGQTLDYNVKLSDRQQTYARLAAKTLERNTFLHNIEEKIVEKRLLISNIKLAILNMHQYVQSRAVVLPGDKTDQVASTRSVPDQLANIISHIEDLEEVNYRVIVSDDNRKYNEPLLSEESEMRCDF